MRALLPLALASTIMMTPKLCQAVSVEVKEGQNQIVKLNISSPGVEDLVSVSPASGYAFSQSPYLANNPSGLWWDAGGNTFKVAFVDDQVTSADMTVAGKLKKTGGGGSGGGGPQEWDFTQPGVATLTGQVGAVFEKPDEYWVLASPYPDTVDCRVRFYSADGTVGEPSGRNYTWGGDNLGSLGSATFADECDSFTYTVSQDAAEKQGQIKGNFTGLTVNGSGAFSAKATSMTQKAFEISLVMFQINVTEKPLIQAANKIRAQGKYHGIFHLNPDADVSLQGRIPQTARATNLVVFDPPKSNRRMSTADGTVRWDGHEFFDRGGKVGGVRESNTFDMQATDEPHVTPETGFKSCARTDAFDSYVQLKVGKRAWRTYAYNTWGWSGSYTNSTPVGTIVGTSSSGSGQQSAVVMMSESPDSQMNNWHWVDAP